MGCFRFHSSGSRWLRVSFGAALLHLLATGAMAQGAEPAPSAPMFQPRPFGPVPAPTAEPTRRTVELEETKPIPRGWIVGGIVAAGLTLAALSYGSMRAWRSSSLFDRQYRFPRGEEVPGRLGGKRSGGHLATVRFVLPTHTRHKD